MTHASGSVVLADLGDAPFGHEQSGYRPAIVLSSQHQLTIVVPLTSNERALRFKATAVILPTKQNGLIEPSVALGFQIRAIDSHRIVRRIGAVDTKDKKRINKAIRSVTFLH